MNLPDDIAAMLNDAAIRHGLPQALLRAVAWVESRGIADAVSPAGAMGIMQLMPETAKGLGVDDPFNPETNIDGGARFLARLLRKYGGNIATALAAYNWGPGNVDRKSTWPSSVIRYVQKVNARAEVEDAILAATTDPRLTTEDAQEGGGEAPIPFAVAGVQQSGSELLYFRPPHCCTCSCGEGGDDDTR